MHPIVKWNMRCRGGTGDVKMVVEQHGAAKDNGFQYELNIVLELVVFGMWVVVA